jgi:hypothetical protein
MDTVRVDNLKNWLDNFEGKVASFCRYYQLPRSRASFLSQVLSGHRTLGEKAARKLEAETGRPVGWLDREQPKEQPLRYDVERVRELSKSNRKLIEDFIEFVLSRSELKESDLLAIKKERVIENRHVSQSAHQPISEKTFRTSDFNHAAKQSSKSK